MTTLVCILIALICFAILNDHKNTKKTNRFGKKGDSIDDGTRKNSSVKIDNPTFAKQKAREDIKHYEIQRWVDETINFLDKKQSLEDLLILKEVAEINYGDLLNCFEWKFQRLEILWRDSYKCHKCGKRDLQNHVHHMQYIKNQLPWEIDGKYLQTLCRKCHVQVHKEQEIPIYSFSNGQKIKISNYFNVCQRCEGTGYIPQYSHIQNGVCFKCQGNSVDRTIFSDILNDHLKTNQKFKESLKRAKYKDFLRNIKTSEFAAKFCNVEAYEKKPEPSKWEDYADDDLPF